MSHIEVVHAVEQYRERCEDSVGILQFEQRTVIVVADGAGGVGAGDLAAKFVVHEVELNHASVHSADEWADLLKQIDFKIAVGESTAVVVDIRPYGIAGASVGDSCAWIFHDAEIAELTGQQIRKPLLGSGQAQPVGFTSETLSGTLLVGSDGLFDYAGRSSLQQIIHTCEFFELPRRCIESVRLPSGKLWDDTAVVAARPTPMVRTRRRYEI